MTRPIAQRLREIAAALDSGHRPTERAFLAVGGALAEAEAGLAQVGRDLSDLSLRMSEGEAATAAARLGEAADQVIGLAAEGGVAAGVLAGVATRTGEVAVLLDRLRKIVSEVPVLALNAKVQAAMLPHGAAEMAVFTVEIARLGGAALASLERTGERLVRLRGLLGKAHAEVAAFDGEKGGEWEAVRGRLRQALGAIDARRDDAARSTAAIGERSVEVAAELAAAVGEMQINDIAAQRVAHVVTVLGLVAEIVSGGEVEAIAGIAPERRAPLAGAVLRLQAAQLARTRADFCGQAEALGGRLARLAETISGVRALAHDAFGGRAGGASFVGDLEPGIAATRDLLQRTEEARRAVRGLTDATAADFAEMTADLKEIRSIDADVRVMALNATLRCGRLGAAGQALAVVAQALRGCSNRTEEQARALSAALAGAIAEAAKIEAGDGGDGGALTAMEDGIGVLRGLGEVLDAALAGLDAETARLSAGLAAAAGRFDVARRVGEALDRAVAEIGDLADAVDPERSDPAALRAEVEGLLAGHYTMDTERTVHALFADDDAPAASDDLDELFL
ncbi:putative methyl-accepting chemotaxis sensory transducer [uncultured Alphaproteobacteria bacterium]|uniref:Putative methyl-accepting chemotaxis sensory transducer n=1 Tax=uncultured Alphaproteobacteria bacterium TaxID=91750 RepID=A0A212KKP4_9PROT|nr:putative methyl-accepting chemotaxis sensory transducer [uncultured Alphaproteobacteria bacterium]